MRKQGSELLVLDYAKKALYILVILSLLLTPNSSLLTTYAQTATPSAIPRTTQNSTKNTVRNFKINLNEYSSFGTDCAQKSRGDANCDIEINEFDLSIWEVEFNSPNPPKRADFNNDGVVNLLDYGIWRNTTFPSLSFQRRLESNNLLSFLSSFLNLTAQRQALLKSLILNPAYAQESGGGEVNSSNTFTSGSGNSMVINTLNGGNTQQVNFNQNGNPQSASFFDPNGQSYAEVAFTNSGGTIIATQDNGIPITISKTASGPIIENFKNPDGSLLAIKSWPTQASYDAGQPPLAVTIPGQGATKEVLNMQPNGDGIVEKLDAAGNILNRTQLRSNGTIVTEDLRNQIIVQSNTEIGFTNLSMKNNLGGQTQYMFYQGSLYALVQTDSGNNAYVSKPTDTSGNSWTFETLVDGVKRAEKTTTDPIAEAKSNTPTPQSLIQYINYYKQAQINPNAVTFSEGFTSTAPAIANPVNKANSILAISQAQTPAVLGLNIIKEALAAEVESKPDSKGSVIGIDVNNESQRNGQPRTDVIVQVFEKNPSDPTGGLAATDLTVVSLPRGSELPNFSNMTPEQVQSWANNQISAGNPAFSGPNIGDPTKQGGVNYTSPTAPNGAQQPAAALPANPAAQAAPQTGPKSESQQALDAAAEAAAKNGGSPAEQGKAAYDAALSAAKGFDMPTEKANNLANDAFSHSYLAAALREAGVEEKDIQGKTGAELANIAHNRGIEPVREINTARSQEGLSPVISPFSSQSSNTSTAPPSGAAAGAAAAPGIPTPQSGMIGATGFYSQVSVSTNPNYPPGTFESTIKSGGAEGETVATQIHNPAGGGSQWNDAATGQSYSAHHGNYTGTSIGGGLSVGFTADGNLAVGVVDPVTGFVVDSGIEVTEADKAAYDAGQISHVEAGGGAGTSVGNQANGMCFLPGTLISTPFGSKAIETLTIKDQVYSYNEKTGQKEISTFEELDVNFVDEYLIINNQIKTTTYHPFYVLQSKNASSAYSEKSSAYTVIPRLMRDPEHTTILKTIRADELQLGDILLNEQGQQIPVYSIEKVAAPKTTVYNLNNVSKNNNFFAEGILVHNYGGGGSGSVDDTGSQSYDSWSDNSGWSDGSASSDTTTSDTSSTDQGSQQSDANSSGADSSGW